MPLISSERLVVMLRASAKRARRCDLRYAGVRLCDRVMTPRGWGTVTRVVRVTMRGLDDAVEDVQLASVWVILEDQSEVQVNINRLSLDEEINGDQPSMPLGRACELVAADAQMSQDGMSKREALDYAVRTTSPWQVASEWDGTELWRAYARVLLVSQQEKHVSGLFS